MSFFLTCDAHSVRIVAVFGNVTESSRHHTAQLADAELFKEDMHYPKNTSTGYLRKLSFAILALLAGCSQQEPAPSNIFAAVYDGNSAYVTAWIKNGGDPNMRDASGQSLLYLATGPHGGHDVLTALLIVDPHFETVNAG